MNIIGIICEYNPFHNGHLYHINKIKELYKDSLIILVLNGYFLERGEVSIISKYNKTLLALKNNVDIVVELPFIYGTQSADVFALESIKILNELKANLLVFGSESNDINSLNKMVDYTINNDRHYNEEVKEYLSLGLNYPTAMAKALNSDFIFKSNDLLGLSYIKAIKKTNSNIKPVTIKRTNEYLDKNSNEEIISASNIREKMKNNIDISKYVPATTIEFIKNISLDDYFDIIKYKIITDHNLSDYVDVEEGIENRLKKMINKVNTTDELIKAINSKRYTYNRISRMLVHILIGFKKSDNVLPTTNYIKILGFNKTGQEYIHTIKKDVNLIVDKKSLRYNYEIKACSIYQMIYGENVLKDELSTKPIFYK